MIIGIIFGAPGDVIGDLTPPILPLYDFSDSGSSMYLCWGF